MSKLPLLLLFLTVGACTTEPYFQWETGTHPRAVLADGTTDPVWTDMVEAARAKWAGPLVFMGCPDPFRGSNTNPVILIPDKDWGIPTATGETRSFDMRIKGTVDEMIVNESYETILPHELGHALGLEHVLDDSDPESVMHPSNGNKIPSKLDLTHVAELLGCDG